MILSMADQTTFFMLTVLLGAVSGFIYDIFRIIRKIVKHPDFLTQFEDLLYWVVVSILFFYYILHRNSGEVRIYAIIGMFSGMCLYFLTLSKLIIRASVFIIDLVKKIISAAVRIILIPLKFLVKLLSYPGLAIKKWVLDRYSDTKTIIRKTNRLAGIRITNLKREIYIIRKKI